MKLKCEFELMNLIIAFQRCFKQRRKRSENSDLNGDSNPDLCDAGAVLHQLRYQANWEQVVVWVDYKFVNVEIGDDNPGFFILLKYIGQGSNPRYKA